MGNIRVKGFTGGLDTRRLPETLPGSSLIRAVNCHVNRGEELEQRADFVLLANLEAGVSKRLAATRAGLVLFGSGATAPDSMPSNATYQRLQHPNGTTGLVDVTHWTLFEGKVCAIGAYANGDRFLFVDGVLVTDANAPPNLAGSAPPSALLTFGSKLYVAAGPALYFSAVGDASDFAGTGAGFIDMSAQAEGSDQIVALARYQNRIAVFGEESIQTWFMDPDPSKNAQDQVLMNTGCASAYAATGFRDGDVLYLDTSGVRSMRARDSSSSAITTDIGSPVDTLLISDVANGFTHAVAAVEPRDGRYWLAVDGTIYVFSFFPTPKISAWTTYDPGFDISDLVIFNRRVYIRAGESLYVYGGEGAQFSYGAAEAEIWLPYLDANAPAQAKHVTGFDAAARGSWEVRMGLAPENLGASDLIGTIVGSTFTKERHAMEGSANHVSMRFRSTASPSATAPAVLSSVVIHHNLDADEDSA